MAAAVHFESGSICRNRLKTLETQAFVSH